MGGISIWQIAIVVVIVLVLFGSKKLGNLGGELGRSIKGFKKEMKSDDSKENIEHGKSDDTISTKEKEHEETKS